MKRLTYLQNRTVYYSLFVSALLGRAPREIYMNIAPIFFTEGDELIAHLMTSDELDSLHSCDMLELYRNYIASFCEDSRTFGRRSGELEAINIKLHVMNIIEQMMGSPTGNVLAALCENYDKNMSVVYALALHCSNPSAKPACITALRKALRDADGLDACISLLYLEPGRREWLEALNRNETIQFYPEVRNIIESHYQVAP